MELFRLKFQREVIGVITAMRGRGERNPHESLDSFPPRPYLFTLRGRGVSSTAGELVSTSRVRCRSLEIPARGVGVVGFLDGAHLDLNIRH